MTFSSDLGVKYDLGIEESLFECVLTQMCLYTHNASNAVPQDLQ